MCKFIFVTGGVISGLGKGIASASIGALLTEFNFKVNIKKLDPYLNIDPGTISPKEHGEVFVTSDGLETDLDLGYYERFANIKTNKHNSTSSGKLYQKLLQEERNMPFYDRFVNVYADFCRDCDLLDKACHFSEKKAVPSPTTNISSVN